MTTATVDNPIASEQDGQLVQQLLLLAILERATNGSADDDGESLDEETQGDLDDLAELADDPKRLKQLLTESLKEMQEQAQKRLSLIRMAQDGGGWSRHEGKRGGVYWTHSDNPNRKVYREEMPGAGRKPAAGGAASAGGEAKAKPEPKVKRAQAKAAKPVKPTVADLHAHIQGLLSGKEPITPDHVADTANKLASLTVKQLGELKEKLGVKASGAKGVLAKKIAEKVLADRKESTTESAENSSKTALTPDAETGKMPAASKPTSTPEPTVNKQKAKPAASKPATPKLPNPHAAAAKPGVAPPKSAAAAFRQTERPVVAKPVRVDPAQRKPVADKPTVVESKKPAAASTAGGDPFAAAAAASADALGEQIRVRGDSLKDKIYSLADADVKVFDPLLQGDQQKVREAGIAHNEPLRSLSSRYDGLLRTANAGSPADSATVQKTMQLTREKMHGSIAGLRTLGMTKQANWYEQHALPLVDVAEKDLLSRSKQQPTLASSRPVVAAKPAASKPAVTAKPAAKPVDPVKARADVLGHVQRLAGQHDNYIPLAELKKALPDMPTQNFHNAIQRLRHDGVLTASAAEGRHGITPEMEETGIREEGNETSLLTHVGLKQQPTASQPEKKSENLTKPNSTSEERIEDVSSMADMYANRGDKLKPIHAFGAVLQRQYADITPQQYKDFMKWANAEPTKNGRPVVELHILNEVDELNKPGNAAWKNHTISRGGRQYAYAHIVDPQRFAEMAEEYFGGNRTVPAEAAKKIRTVDAERAYSAQRDGEQLTEEEQQLAQEHADRLLQEQAATKQKLAESYRRAAK